MRETLIDGRWPVKLPPHRADRPEWFFWEAARLTAMHHHLKPGDVLYDIGSEEGDLSALYATWGCQVVLVEANPKAWPCIKATFEANDVRPLAWWWGLLADHMWTVDSEKRFGQEGWPEPASGEMVPDHGFYSVWEHGMEVGATTLDRLVGMVAKPPTAITIDVEGSELHVLRGAEKTLRAHKPIVFVSVHPEFMRVHYDLDARELHEFMGGLGYDSQFLATDHEEHWVFR